MLPILSYHFVSLCPAVQSAVRMFEKFPKILNEEGQKNQVQETEKLKISRVLSLSACHLFHP